eukprot:11225072-Lingulodinium_polyedra.AAC.1
MPPDVDCLTSAHNPRRPTYAMTSVTGPWDLRGNAYLDLPFRYRAHVLMAWACFLQTFAICLAMSVVFVIACLPRCP